jgi:hypothetical protein
LLPVVTFEKVSLSIRAAHETMEGLPRRDPASDGVRLQALNAAGALLHIRDAFVQVRERGEPERQKRHNFTPEADTHAAKERFARKTAAERFELKVILVHSLLG